MSLLALESSTSRGNEAGFRRGLESYIAAISPIPTTGLQGWWDSDDASTFTYSSGSVVSEWRDKSGQGNHVVQGTVSKQPLRGGTRNGKTTVIFDGTQGLKRTPITPIGTSTSQFSVFITVIKTGAPVSYNTLFSLSMANTDRPYEAYDQYRYIMGNYWATAPNLASVLNNWCVYSIELDRGTPVPSSSGNLTERRDGIVLGSYPNLPNGTFNLTSQEICIATRSDMVTFLRGEIGEVILYDRILSTVERQQVEAYLAEKWNPPFIPTSITSLSGWYDASDAASITSSAGAVSQWNDKSGLNRHMTQVTENRKPITGSKTFNGKNVLAMGGTPQKWMGAPSAQYVDATTGAWTRFAVLTVNVQQAGHARIIDSESQAQVSHYYNLFAAVATGSAPDYSPAFVLPGPHCVSAVSTGSTTEAWSNGVSDGLTNAAQVSKGAVVLRVNAYWTDGANGGDIDLAEAICYNRALSTVERQQVESYLKAKWGTP